MLNRLLYEFYKSPNNGRQIASLGDGRRVLLVHSEIAGPATLRLMVARHQTPQSIADFDDAGVLAGRDSIVPDGGPWGFGGSMVVAGNAIHAAWTGPHGIEHARATWVGKRLHWDPARHIFEGDYWLGDLFLVGKQLALSWHRTDDRQNESVGVVWLKETRWQVQQLQRVGHDLCETVRPATHLLCAGVVFTRFVRGLAMSV
jgi:hypothetical protein